MSETLENKNADLGRVICFSLGQELFALPILKVREVIGYLPPTPIPDAAPYFKGILNLRGRVISVLDLKARLRMPKAELPPSASIIILETKDLSLGIIVDSVNAVMAISEAELSGGQEICDSRANEYVRHVIKKEKSLILVLDVEKCVSAQELQNLKAKAA